MRDDNVIFGGIRNSCCLGERAITDSIHDLKFSISSKSFYQVNPRQTEILYGKALEFAQLTGKERCWICIVESGRFLCF